MPSNHEKPKRISPRGLLLGRTPGALSLWPRAQHDSRKGAAAARDLVAIWAGIRRLVEGPLVDSLSRLERAVTDDAAALGAALASIEFRAAEWCQRAEDLDVAWDTAERDEEDLDWQTYTLFEELDRTSLACWWLRKQVGEAPDVLVEHLTREVKEAEAHLADKVNLFLSLATDAAAVLSESRPDLESTEPLLWDTLLKHRRIEAARDEIELSPRRRDMIGMLERWKPQPGPVLPPTPPALHRLDSNPSSDSGTR